MNKLSLLLLLPVVALSGCDSISGEIKVSQEFPVKVREGFLGLKTRIGNLKKGTYEATLAPVLGGGVQIVLKQGDRQSHLPINITNKSRLPKYDGRLDLPASETGQPFDLVGDVNSERSQSDLIRTTESCSRTKYVRECKRDKCEDVSITITGEQDVEYYYSYIDTYLSAKVMKPRKSQVLAKFNGSRRESSKNYTYQGACW